MKTTVCETADLRPERDDWRTCKCVPVITSRLARIQGFHIPAVTKLTELRRWLRVIVPNHLPYGRAGRRELRVIGHRWALTQVRAWQDRNPKLREYTAECGKGLPRRQRLYSRRLHTAPRQQRRMTQRYSKMFWRQVGLVGQEN